jgi:hypothetical protein
MIIAILIYLVAINTFGILFGLYGLGSSKGWWK